MISKQFRAPFVFLVALTVFITALISGISPRLMPIIFFFFVITILFLARQKESKHSIPRQISSFLQQQTITDPPILIFVFSFYLCLNSLWAYSFESAISKALLVALTTLIVLLSRSLFETFTKIELWRVVRGILIGFLVGLLFLFIEFLLDHILTKIFLSEIIFVEQEKGMIASDQNFVKKIYNSYFNNHITTLNILFWPTLLLTALWSKDLLGRAIYGMLFCLMVIVTFLSDSETSKLALILGTITFIAARYKPRMLHNLLFSGWIMAVIFIIPLVFILYSQGYQNSSWLPHSAKHRIYIWHDTTVDIMENPVGGIGISSSRHKAKKAIDKTPPLNGKKRQFSTGVHPHNIFLQSWYELGLLGTFLLLTVVLSLLQRIRHMTIIIQPYAYASFISMSTVAAFGYGMWESWLMSGYSWSILFLIVAMTYEKQLSS